MRSRATDAFGNALGNSLAVGGTSHDDASLRLIRQGQPDLPPPGDRLLRRLNGQSQANPYQYFFQFSDVGHLIGTGPLLKPDGDPYAPDIEHFFCPRTVSIK